MLKTNSQRYHSNRKATQTFSFAEIKPHLETSSQEKGVITSQNCQNFAMWLLITFEQYPHEVVHDLKNIKNISLLELDRFIARNYMHFQTIIRFYIVNAFMYWGKCTPQNWTKAEFKESEETSIRKVIEFIANRYFRQSQWFEKISDIPIYQIFPLFDKYYKGYTNLNNLKTFIVRQLGSIQTIKNISHKKSSFTKSILGKQSERITQEDLLQLMLRVNSNVFAMKAEKQEIRCEQYQYIKRIILQQQQQETKLQQSTREINMMRSKKQLDTLTVAREDAEIRLMSERKVRRDNVNIDYPLTYQKPIDVGKENMPVFNHYWPEMNETSKLAQTRDYFSVSGQHLLNQIQLRKIEQKQVNTMKMKAAILKELDTIRYQKSVNHRHLLRYI